MFCFGLGWSGRTLCGRMGLEHPGTMQKVWAEHFVAKLPVTVTYCIRGKPIHHYNFNNKKCKWNYFFFPRLFDHRLSSSNDCFTGQSPGIGHDGSHLYTGGPRMCIGEGQVQAGLLRRGLGVCCSVGGWGLQRGSH